MPPKPEDLKFLTRTLADLTVPTRRTDAGEEEEQGVFEGYLSVFDVVDSYGTYMAKGAFKRTLKEKGDTRALLFMHNYMEWPVGVLRLKEDDKGLWARGELNLETRAGKEAYALVKQGAVAGMSQGFNIITAREDKTKNATRVEEVDLWEGSLTTLLFNSTPGADILAVRSRQNAERIAALDRHARARRLDAAIANARRLRDA